MPQFGNLAVFCSAIWPSSHHANAKTNPKHERLAYVFRQGLRYAPPLPDIPPPLLSTMPPRPEGAQHYRNRRSRPTASPRQAASRQATTPPGKKKHVETRHGTSLQKELPQFYNNIQSLSIPITGKGQGGTRR